MRRHDAARVGFCDPLKGSATHERGEVHVRICGGLDKRRCFVRSKTNIDLFGAFASGTFHRSPRVTPAR